MEFDQLDVNGVTVVRMTGRLDSETAGDVMDRLNAAVSGGGSRIVVNLHGVSYISSAGLRSLLVAAKLAHSMSGALRLCEANDRVEKVLTTSGFTNLINLDAQEAQSVAAFAKG